MRLPAALLLLTAGLAVGACRNDAPGDPPRNAADTMQMGAMHDMMARGAYSDARFLREMTVHHRMALDMAAMAPAMAASADLKAMAAKMNTDQTREIAEMERLLATMGEAPDTSAGAMSGMDHGAMNGGGMDHGAMSGGAMNHDMMGMPMTMDELRAARPFDRAFLVSMIGHHASAVTMAAEAQARSTSADVLRLARGIVTAQAEEMGRMQRMVDAMGAAPAP